MEVPKSKIIFALAVAGFILLMSLPGKASENIDSSATIKSEEVVSAADEVIGEEDELPIEEQNSATILNQETGDFSEDEDSSVEE